MAILINMFSEKIFEDILCKYPDLIDDGLRFVARQITLYGRRMDILFEDKFHRKLIVELKAGPIKDQHIGQILSYEGMLLSSDDPTIRVMLIGTRVPPNLQKSLDHHGIAWKEFTVRQLRSFLTKNNDSSLLKIIEENDPMSRVYQNNKINQGLTNPVTGIRGKASSRIYEQIIKVLKDRKGDIVTHLEIVELLNKVYGTNPASILPSDYCYNRTNIGIKFDKHLFEYIDRGTYRYLGEYYPYTGRIFAKPQGQESEIEVGEWKNGVKELSNIPMLTSRRVTKKSVCLEFLNKENGGSIEEMAQAIVDRGIDPDYEKNKRTCRLWMSKIGVVVKKLPNGNFIRVK